jgi:hypothetical protein
MRAILGLVWSTKRSRREYDEQEIERELCSGSRACVISMLVLGVNVLGNSPAFDCSCSVSVFVHWSTHGYPFGGDTVAISGFPRLPLCFTGDAAFGVRGLVIVPSLVAKRCPRIGSSSFARG